MAIGTLIIRADASPSMGHGHVMRCLALAQAWQDAGGEVIFVMADPPKAIVERLAKEGILAVHVNSPAGSITDVAQLLSEAQDRRSSWVVLDGYHFPVQYQRTIKDAGFKLLLVDDTGGGQYFADLVLNQNLHATEKLYEKRELYTRLLLGTRYAMLRREFARWREWKREIPPVARKVLVTMGGSDPENVTGRALEALLPLSMEGVEAAVVVGGSNPHRKSLQQLAGEAGGAIRIHEDVADMAELIAWADIAVSGAGSTCWEICLLGLPALLIDLAPNQRPLGEGLQRESAAVHLDNLHGVSAEEIARKLQELAFSPEARGLMSRRAQELVDGKGAARVMSVMSSSSLRIRRADIKDCRLFWEWANDPEVRAASFSTEPIPWNSHVQWFAARLADPSSVLYVVTTATGESVGEVRYQIEGNRAVVSLCLGRDFRGQGYSEPALGLSMEDLQRLKGAISIDAYVKPGNNASLRMFERAGFRLLGLKENAGRTAVHFVSEGDGAAGDKRCT